MSSSYGLYKIKVSESFLSLEFSIGLVCYILGFLIWFAILKLYPLSIVFPIAASLLIVSTQLIGFFFLEEKVALSHLLGVSFIIIGIIILFNSSWENMK